MTVSQQVVLSWADALAEEKEKRYFKDIMAFLDDEARKGKTIYPAPADRFNALKLTPFDQVKVVILGQDPYHGPGQAHGLSFSVPNGVPIPPSLRNIYQEIHKDLGVPIPKHGNLEHWARQGVLLLNTSLSVEAARAASHAGIGWDIFTDQVIKQLNVHRSGLVFLLWGAHAGRKADLIDPRRHRIFKSPHPSPLSASRGFFGCKHFSKTNDHLTRQGLKPIDWAG